MKLYYSPGACSLSPHIALRESGLKFELVLASTKTGKLQDGTDYLTINAKGQVPVLEAGQRPASPRPCHRAVHRRPGAREAPRATWGHDGALPRDGVAQLRHLRNCTRASHRPSSRPCPKRRRRHRQRLSDRLKWVDSQLEGKDYLTGSQFTVADGYLFVVAGWGLHVGVDISGLHLSAFMAVSPRPRGQQEALKAEGG